MSCLKVSQKMAVGRIFTFALGRSCFFLRMWCLCGRYGPSCFSGIGPGECVVVVSRQFMSVLSQCLLHIGLDSSFNALMKRKHGSQVVRIRYQAADHPAIGQFVESASTGQGSS